MQAHTKVLERKPYTNILMIADKEGKRGDYREYERFKRWLYDACEDSLEFEMALPQLIDILKV